MTEYGKLLYVIATVIVLGVMFALMWRDVGRRSDEG